MIRSITSVVTATLAWTASGAPIAIDGQFNEWGREHVVAVDVAGDATGAFDLTRLAIMSRGPVVHVHFDTGRVLNLQSGPDSDGTLKFRFRSLQSGREVHLDTRGRSVTIVNDEVPRETNWHEVGYWSAPTFAADEFEFRIDLSSIDAQPGEVIELVVSGSDSLDQPVRFTLDGAPETSQAQPLTLDDLEEGQLRAISLNTWRNGIVNQDRSDALLRLIRFASPDIVLLQEEYNTAAAVIQTALEETFGTNWNVVKVRDNVIASPMPLTEVASFNDAYAAAILTAEDGLPRLILCVHPKCCGHIGSTEDLRRVEETRAMKRTISLARQRYGEDLPILLAGDWNLVGSRSPLDLLTSPAGAGLRLLEARNPSTQSVYTWYAPNSDFAPGLLDLAAVSESAASRSGAFIVDSRTIDSESLRALGLREEDSAASDHLMLIIDFGI
jgi:hypothetical protein